MIEIWEPRYHDNMVLIAPWKIVPDQDQKIQIQKGHYKGNYTLPYEDIIGCEMAPVKTKRGAEVQMVCVPLDKLRKEEDEEEHI